MWHSFRNLNRTLVQTLLASTAAVALWSISSPSWSQTPTQIRLDNPCIPGQACDWEDLTLNAPVAESLMPEAATKGVGDCFIRRGPQCDTPKVQTTKVYVQKKDRATFSQGRVTRVVNSTSNTQIMVTEQVVGLPVAGQATDNRRYDNLRFGWFHTNGSTINADHKFRTGDLVKFLFSSSSQGHVYVVNVDSAGAQTLLYPAPSRPAERSVVPPNADVLILTQFEGKTGIERVYAIFSPAPIDNLSALTANVHRSFDGRPVDEMRLQQGNFNQRGELSFNGVLLSEGLKSGSKGLVAFSSSVETSRATPTLMTGAVVRIDPLVTTQHPYSVMAIDLIHISR